MEIMIIICLITVIVLLLKDKVVVNKIVYRKEIPQSPVKTSTDIMGASKSQGLSIPNKDRERQKIKPLRLKSSFEQEGSEVKVPQEEPGKNFQDDVDLDEEEAEWMDSREPDGEDGFAMGVTFGELSSVKDILQKSNADLHESQKQKAIEVIRKIEGTELFELLENSIENASYRIAALLDRQVGKFGSGSSTMRNKDADNFEIGDFI